MKRAHYLCPHHVRQIYPTQNYQTEFYQTVGVGYRTTQERIAAQKTRKELAKNAKKLAKSAASDSAALSKRSLTLNSVREDSGEEVSALEEGQEQLTPEQEEEDQIQANRDDRSDHESDLDMVRPENQISKTYDRRRDEWGNDESGNRSRKRTPPGQSDQRRTTSNKTLHVRSSGAYLQTGDDSLPYNSSNRSIGRGSSRGSIGDGNSARSMDGRPFDQKPGQSLEKIEEARASFEKEPEGPLFAASVGDFPPSPKQAQKLAVVDSAVSLSLPEGVSLRESLSKIGLHIWKVPADGNCLFHALLRSLGEVGDSSPIRLAIADWLETHAEQNPLIAEGIALQEWADGVPLEEWIARLRQGSIWGTLSDVTISSLIWKRPIVVFSKFSSQPIICKPPDSTPHSPPLYLLHHVLSDGNPHFDALLPTDLLPDHVAKIGFFKHYRVRKALLDWRNNARKEATAAKKKATAAKKDAREQRKQQRRLEIEAKERSYQLAMDLLEKIFSIDKKLQQMLVRPKPNRY